MRDYNCLRRRKIQIDYLLKISAACKLINRSEGGPLDINDQVMEAVHQKHPEAQFADKCAIVEDRTPCFVEQIELS